MKKLLLASLILFVVDHSYSQICFGNFIDFDAGRFPTSFCINDFNEDSNLDIAVANGTSQNVTIVFGNGDGTFSGLTTIMALSNPGNPSSIDTGDFNNDSHQDIAVANLKQDTVSIYYGQGDGNFIPGTELGFNHQISKIATNDFNQDGYSDVVIISNGTIASGNFYIFISDGLGGYNMPLTPSTTNYLRAVKVADINSDTKNDIVMIKSNGIISLLGDGSGNFSSPLTPVFGFPFQFVDFDLGDINEDGKMDILAADTSQQNLRKLYGDGSGGFSDGGGAGLLPGRTYNCYVVDFNNDTHLDFAAATHNTDQITIAFGNGTGVFFQQAYLTVYDKPIVVIGGDLDSDSDIDLIVINDLDSADNSLVLLRTIGINVTASALDTSICWGDSITLIGGGADTYAWSAGTDGVPFLPSPDTTTTYTVTGTSSGCTGTASVTIQVAPYQTQSICVVTADSAAADHNIIIWEKNNDPDIDSIIIYREITLNNYQRVGAVEYDSLSLFHDYGANPNTTSYKYKLKAKSNCGSEGPTSIYHNSIHLQYLGLGNFQWTYYEIEGMTNQVSSYNFYRDDNATGNFQLLNIIPGNNHTYTDINYNSFPNALYRVDLEWISAHECVPTRSEGSTSRSNIKGQIIDIGIEDNNVQSQVQIFPNPSNGIFNIQIPVELLGTKLIVSDALGKIVLTTQLQQQKDQIDLSALTDGIYFLNLISDHGKTSKKLLKY